MDPPPLYQFRMILIGDSTAGKSSLLKFFTQRKFEVSSATIGVDFFTRMIELKNGIKIKLQLWDTAGQEKFRSVTKSYYRNAVGALLVYDICNRASFERIPMWMNEAKRESVFYEPSFVLVGCKMDLASINGSRAVKFDEAKAFADTHNMPFFETSAKSGACVEKAFLAITEIVYRRIQSGDCAILSGWDGVKIVSDEYDTERNHYVEVEAENKSSCC